MKLRLIIAIATATILAGCASTPQYHTPDGQKVQFVASLLKEEEKVGGTYVLIELEGAGTFKLVSISQERPRLENKKQERIVFSSDLSRYAIDFTSAQFKPHKGQRGGITYRANCGARSNSLQKPSSLSPCETYFSDVHISTEQYNAYSAGHMSHQVYESLKDPESNAWRVIVDPASTLETLGAFNQLGLRK
ncbi:MAG: hypothetical protein P1U47_11965 [Zhongshania sp.]|uniref:hypothetical protein n=1 Tax=Zhongshania sp. TaxID=1971902 RepID=UPI002604663E|nr:hypothetical protein [Zhongshania sp.]MDF1693085.1 hypothetical protein [Zhongshania sp.]